MVSSLKLSSMGIFPEPTIGINLAEDIGSSRLGKGDISLG